MARSAPSRRETAPALTSARTSRSLLAPPESVVALVFSLRLTHYPRSLWIGEYFRGSLDSRQRRQRDAELSFVPVKPSRERPPAHRALHRDFAAVSEKLRRIPKVLRGRE